MGKTLQAISLILDNKPNPDDKAQDTDWINSDSSHLHDPNNKIINHKQMPRGGTLVVLPTVGNWVYDHLSVSCMTGFL